MTESNADYLAMVEARAKRARVVQAEQEAQRSQAALVQKRAEASLFESRGYLRASRAKKKELRERLFNHKLGRYV